MRLGWLLGVVSKGLTFTRLDLSPMHFTRSQHPFDNSNLVATQVQKLGLIRRDFLDLCTSIVNLFFSIYLFSLEKEGQPTTAKEFILIWKAHNTCSIGRWSGNSGMANVRETCSKVWPCDDYVRFTLFVSLTVDKKPEAAKSGQALHIQVS